MKSSKNKIFKPPLWKCHTVSNRGFSLKIRRHLWKNPWEGLWKNSPFTVFVFLYQNNKKKRFCGPKYFLTSYFDTFHSIDTLCCSGTRKKISLPSLMIRENGENFCGKCLFQFSFNWVSFLVNKLDGEEELRNENWKTCENWFKFFCDLIFSMQQSP